jgi:hypothetical protein
MDRLVFQHGQVKSSSEKSNDGCGGSTGGGGGGDDDDGDNDRFHVPAQLRHTRALPTKTGNIISTTTVNTTAATAATTTTTPKHHVRTLTTTRPGTYCEQRRKSALQADPVQRRVDWIRDRVPQPIQRIQQ